MEIKASSQIAIESSENVRASGILIMSGGKTLLIKRSPNSTYGGKWALPGGGIEAGETPEEAAIRECTEEIGYVPDGELSEIAHTANHGADFTTFYANHSEEKIPTLNEEHTEYAWVTAHELGEYDLHPGVKELFAGESRKDSVETEFDIAEKIKNGELESPQRYANITLFDIRITGTGVSYRVAHNEYVFRDPDLYLNDGFLRRCNGLPVIIEHPKEDTLNSKEFSDRIIGTVLLPYIKGNEVWGIAKIYDDAGAEIMAENQISTSPAVVFHNAAKNEKIELEDGNNLLIEGEPSLLDHLAVVSNGVWDKGGKPSGVKNAHAEKAEASKKDSADPTCSLLMENFKMAEKEVAPEVKKDEAGEVTLASVMAAVQAIAAKVDRLESAEEAESAALAKPDESAAMPAPEQGATAEPAADNAKPSAAILDMQKRMDEFESKLPKEEPKEEDRAAMADAQAKADSVYAAFGDSAPRPLQGETLLAYRKRLAAKMQPHCKAFKDVNLSACDATVLNAIEAQIYADAQVAASSPAAVPAGVLMERTTQDATGRKITTFHGHPSAWTKQFKAPKRNLTRVVTQFH